MDKFKNLKKQNANDLFPWRSFPLQLDINQPTLINIMGMLTTGPLKHLSVKKKSGDEQKIHQCH